MSISHRLFAEGGRHRNHPSDQPADMKADWARTAGRLEQQRNEAATHPPHIGEKVSIALSCWDDLPDYASGEVVGIDRDYRLVRFSNGVERRIHGPDLRQQ